MKQLCNPFVRNALISPLLHYFFLLCGYVDEPYGNKISFQRQAKSLNELFHITCIDWIDAFIINTNNDPYDNSNYILFFSSAVVFLLFLRNLTFFHNPMF